MKKWDEIEVKSKDLFSKTAKFLQNNFGNEYKDILWNEEIFKWKLSDLNPAGKGYMFVAILDDRIIGVATLTKKFIYMNKQKILCAEIGDTYTHPKFRRNVLPKNYLISNQDPKAYINISIFGRLVTSLCLKAKSEGVNFIYGTPNQNSLPGYIKKLNFIDETELNLIPYTKVTSDFFINRKSNFIFIIIFKIFELVMKLITNFLNKLLKFIYKLEFKLFTPSKKEINSIWKFYKTKTDFSLHKDFNYWKHRYLNHPEAQYEFFSIYESGSILGFYVVRIIKLSNEEINLCIADWMLLDEKFMFYSLNNIVSFYNNLKIHKIIVWKLKYKNDKFWFNLNLFFERKRIPVIIRNFSGKQLNNYEIENKHFFMGSADVI